MMIVRLSASGFVAMVLFIPLLLVLGVVLAFAVPILALAAAVGGLVFTGFFVAARVRLGKRKRIGVSKADVEITNYPFL